jgi:hypothetical protein
VEVLMDASMGVFITLMFIVIIDKIIEKKKAKY